MSGPDVWVLFDHKDVNRAGAATDFLVAHLGGAGRALEPRVRQPAAALVGVDDAGVRHLDAGRTPGAQAFFDNLQNAKQPRPTVPGYNELRKFVGEAISKVLQGAATSKDALDRAASQSADALDQ